MGEVIRLTCSHCSLDENGCRTHAYILDLQGERKYCRHPGQDEHGCEILGMDYDELVRAMTERPGEAEHRLPTGEPATAEKFVAFYEKRIGVMSGYLCLACGEWSSLDDNRDPMQCQRCRSENIVMDGKLDGRPCPFCREGTLKTRIVGLI
jgi:DNA-directed RNA polymerase subunit RPC12/RpoP